MMRNKPNTQPTLESTRDRLVIAASSSLGLGLIPFAPGTWGTLGAIPIWWALSGRGALLWIAVTLAVALFAIWISTLAEPLYGAHDVSAIVIDEVAGMLVCVMFIPFTPVTAVVGFVVFRVFDIVKPPPVSWFDKNVSGGLGVVVDDLVAGAMGLAVMHGLRVLLGW